MPYHIMKCQKNFKKADYKYCPFNARHVVLSAAFEEHIRNCPDMGALDAKMLHTQQQNTGAVLKGCTDLPAQDSDYVVPVSTESWEEDNVTYEPPVASGLFTTGRDDHYSSRRAPSSNQQQDPPLPPVKAPPRPRLPQSHGGMDAESEVFWFSQQQQQQLPRPQGVGRGRGRGRGIRPVTPPTQPGGLQQSGVVAPVFFSQPATVEPTPSPSPPPASASAASDSSSGGDKTSEYKKKRKLRKMMNQIVKIQELVDSGEEINEDQRAKLARKYDVIAQIERLNLD